MSDIFDDREKGEEAKYAHDAETEFRIKARRAKLMAWWVADLVKADESNIRALVDSFIGGTLDGGDKAVLELVRESLKAAEIERSDHQLEREMAAQYNVAKEQITG